MLLLDGHIGEVVLTDLLAHGARSTEALIGDVRRVRRGTTKQGVYRVLRKLVQEEKIIVYKSQVSIHELWRERVTRLFTDAEAGAGFAGVAHLGEGEHLALRSANLVHADQIWGQAFVAVEATLPVRHPLYLYNPHNWSILLREEADWLHAERLAMKKRPVYLVLGSSLALDKEAARLSGALGLNYSFAHRPMADAYIACLSDYVFELALSRRGTELMRDIFTTSPDLATARARLERLRTFKIPCRLRIERSTTKARAWKKRLARDFLIPKVNRDF